MSVCLTCLHVTVHHYLATYTCIHPVHCLHSLGHDHPHAHKSPTLSQKPPRTDPTGTQTRPPARVGCCNILSYMYREGGTSSRPRLVPSASGSYGRGGTRCEPPGRCAGPPASHSSSTDRRGEGSSRRLPPLGRPRASPWECALWCEWGRRPLIGTAGRTPRVSHPPTASSTRNEGTRLLGCDLSTPGFEPSLVKSAN